MEPQDGMERDEMGVDLTKSTSLSISLISLKWWTQIQLAQGISAFSINARCLLY